MIDAYLDYTQLKVNRNCQKITKTALELLEIEMMESQGLSVDYNKKEILEEVFEEERSIFTNIIL